VAPRLAVRARGYLAPVQALPSLVALAVTLALAPSALRAFAAGGHTRPNYRGVELPFPAGVPVVAGALVALLALAPLAELAGLDVFRPEAAAVAIYALGVAFLGLVDDLLGGEPRGWRGHGAAVLGGGFSTGALKAVGALGLALYALAGRGDGDARYALSVAVLVLATNLFNLLDLRPGRVAKALVALTAAVALGAWDWRPAAAVGVFAAPLLVLGGHDLRERAMLGDTGANLAGGLAGWMLVLALSTVGLAIALAALVVITLYAEFRSLSTLIERTPLLRQLDSLGRPTHA